MTINYTISEEDLLTYQLYAASKSERILKQRKRNKLIGLVYLPMALIFFLAKTYPVAIMLVLVGILWFFLYPLWDKKRIMNNYQDFINENQKERLGNLIQLEITGEFILAKDKGSESKVQISELEKITEIPSLILLVLKGGISLAIPKQEIVSIHDQLITELKELAFRLNIPYEMDLDWEWK